VFATARGAILRERRRPSRAGCIYRGPRTSSAATKLPALRAQRVPVADATSVWRRRCWSGLGRRRSRCWGGRGRWGRIRCSWLRSGCRCSIGRRDCRVRRRSGRFRRRRLRGRSSRGRWGRKCRRRNRWLVLESWSRRRGWFLGFYLCTGRIRRRCGSWARSRSSSRNGSRRRCGAWHHGCRSGRQLQFRRQLESGRKIRRSRRWCRGSGTRRAAGLRASGIFEFREHLISSRAEHSGLILRLKFRQNAARVFNLVL